MKRGWSVEREWKNRSEREVLETPELAPITTKRTSTGSHLRSGDWTKNSSESWIGELMNFSRVLEGELVHAVLLMYLRTGELHSRLTLERFRLCIGP